MSFDFGLSATASAIENGINNEFQHYANKKEREYGREMADLAWSRDREMWELTNTYNSPLEQRKRLEAAGLNPALMYGKGASPGIASPAPNYNPPKEGHFGDNMGFAINTNGLSGILNAFNQTRKIDSEIELRAEQRRLVANKADQEWWKAALYNPSSQDLENYGVKGGLYETQLQVKEAEMRARLAEAKTKEFQALREQKKFEIWDKQGIDLDQMSNLGRAVGGKGGMVIDAIMNKIKPR